MNEEIEIKIKVSTEVTLYSFWGWTDQESKNIEQLHEKLGKYLSWLTAIDKYEDDVRFSPFKVENIEDEENVLKEAKKYFGSYKEKRIAYKKRQIEEREQELQNMKLDLALDIADKYKNGKTD
jgi:PhoPQ-activated pathogenicity-related protein